MRHFIDILTEGAADYEAMINPVLAAINAPSGDGIAHNVADDVRAKIAAQWDKQVKLGKTLRKADRITWYLRLCRMAILNIYAKALDPAKISKLRHDYDSRADLPFEQDSFSIGHGRYGDAIMDLEHYLSLPIAGIQNYQFRYQSITTVLKDFQALEAKWQEQVRDTIEDNDSKVIIDCGGDWFWVDTEKAYCSKESAAMGHCGNSPRDGTDDHLLSLRKRIMFGTETRWQPHLTFILNGDRLLTEMKGKNNQKPIAKYHPMIVKLLESDYVEGIVGGGYLPENNFSMDDLDKATRDRLIEMKPDLGTIADLYTKYGASDKVFNRIQTELEEYRLEVEGYEGDTVTLQTWASFADFFRDTYDDDAERIAMMAEADFEGWLDMKTEDPETVLEAIVEESEDDVLELLANKLRVRPESAIKALVHMFPNSLPSVFDEVRKETQDACYAAARRKVSDTRLRCYDESLTIKDKQEVVLTMGFDALCYNIAAYKSEDYDSTDGFEYCAQDRDWLAKDDDDDWGGNDDEDDAVGVTAASLGEDATKSVLRHLLGLFDDEHQLSFDF